MGETSSRYKPILKLASGGMATVWIGVASGALGFRQLVAIKKPHPHLFKNPRLREELIVEARLSSLIRHANVVDVRDMTLNHDEVGLVMDYIEGGSMNDLVRAAAARGVRLAPRVAIRIVLDACAGLHAAHELEDERGRPASIIHRDVSPHNILVGTDGVARVVDFGIAKFKRSQVDPTTGNAVKGKLAYMAPEYIEGQPIDRRIDVFGLGVILWETLSGARCFRDKSEAATIHRVLTYDPPVVSAVVPDLGTCFDDLVARSLVKEREARYPTAAALARAIEAAAGPAGWIGTHNEVAAAVSELLGDRIAERRDTVRMILSPEPSLRSLMTPRFELPDTETEPGEMSNTTPTIEAPRGETMDIGGGPEDTIRDPLPAHTSIADVDPPDQPTQEYKRRAGTTRLPWWYTLVLLGLLVAAVSGAILAVVAALGRVRASSPHSPSSSASAVKRR
jgi:serine/threonine-protein kinase